MSLRKPALTLFFLFTSAATTWAHPAWGIVRDRQGNVYFSDTVQVWKISADGRVSVAVPAVHTHELFIDAEDNLYGEHLWYSEGAKQPWKHRVWRRAPDGTISDVVGPRDGFLSDYSFVRDRAGNMYWADRGKVTVIRKRSPGGAITTHSPPGTSFRSVERLAAMADGTLFLMDGGDLRRVAPTGAVVTVTSGLSGKGRPAAEVGRLNYHMGLWTDSERRVYVAAAAEGLVLRVDDAGRVTTVAQSAAPWAPSGGLIDRDGLLWILEYDTKNAQRVRRIDRAGQEQVFSAAASRSPDYE